MRNAHNEYQSNQVETADPKQLVVMLYDGAIKFLDKALLSIEDYKKYDDANRNILRAQDIITELMVSLNMDQGGEIANNLLSLYSYMKKELLEANVNKEKKGIEQVLKMLKDLKGAWTEMETTAAVPASPDRPASRAGFVAQG